MIYKYLILAYILQHRGGVIWQFCLLRLLSESFADTYEELNSKASCLGFPYPPSIQSITALFRRSAREGFWSAGYVHLWCSILNAPESPVSHSQNYRSRSDWPPSHENPTAISLDRSLPSRPATNHSWRAIHSLPEPRRSLHPNGNAR